MAAITQHDFFLITHPVDVTPMSLSTAVVNAGDELPAYLHLVLGVVYKNSRGMPAFKKVRTWNDIQAIFKGEDDELIEEMATLVTDALNSIVTPELSKEMHQGFLKYTKMTTATTKAQMKLKADATLASLSDEDAAKVLDTCADASMSEAIEELRKTRFA